MERLSFYDVKSKKKFNSSKYVLKVMKVKKSKRFFAVATSPSGIKAWRIISELVYKKNKK